MKNKIIKIVLLIASILLLTILALFLPYKWITIVSNGDAIPDYDNPQTALLVIDVQRNLTSKNGTWILNLSQTDEMIKEINHAIEESTKKDIIVIYISNELKKYSVINLFTNRAMEERTNKGTVLCLTSPH